MSKGEVIERVVAQGDLSKLTSEERVSYYTQVCESVGLNPLTRPFEFITLNGKLTLYARKDATDQLRRQHGVSIDKPDIRFEDDWIVVTVAARDGGGRTDSDIGVVNRKDMRGDFGNALMKAVTKAKRRVTLSICGLGFLDETEVETIPDAKPEPQQPVALPPPAKTASASGPKSSPPSKKVPGLPASGAELQKRLFEYDDKLAKRGMSDMGDLVDHVVKAGVKAGYGKDMTTWDAAGIALAVEATKEFEAAREADRAAETVAAGK